MKKRFLTLSLLLGLAFTTLPVHAEVTENIDIDTAGAQSALVTANMDSSFSVKIPKTIVLIDDGTGTNTYSCTYEITTSGDIAGDEVLKVVPDEEVTLSSDGKDDITASVAQEKNSWGYTSLGVDKAEGTVSTTEVSAGSWEGNLNFDISLEAVSENP